MLALEASYNIKSSPFLSKRKKPVFTDFSIQYCNEF